MKTIYFTILLGFSLITTSCVDDYTDANSPPQLDAPTLRISTSSSTATIRTTATNPYQNKYTAYILYGSPVEFTVSIIDAPGKIGSVDVESSITEFATVTVDNASVSAIEGLEKGSFKFTVTPNEDLDTSIDQAFNIVISVTDSQLDDKDEPNPKKTILTVAAVVGSPCLSDGIVPGNYRVTNASFNLDGDTELNSVDSLEKYNGGPKVISILERRPGLYSFDVTGGVWPIFIGTANTSINVDLCGSTISGHSGSVTVDAVIDEEGTTAPITFTLNGTLNDNGTITMTWSYVRDDGETPDSPAKGSYTLTKI